MAIKGTLSKIIFSIGIAIFLFVSFFGIFHVGMSSDGMSNCPFSIGNSMCTMAPLDHVGAALNFLNSLPSQNGFSELISLFNFFALISLTLFLFYFFSPPKLSLANRSIYDSRSKLPQTFLQQAFSRGVLNSKAF